MTPKRAYSWPSTPSTGSRYSKSPEGRTILSSVQSTLLHLAPLTMHELKSATHETHDDLLPDGGDFEGPSAPTRPSVTTFVLMLACWLAWLTAVASDILTGVRKQFWPGQLLIESPIVRYIYMQHINRWPAGGFYTVSQHVSAGQLSA